MKILYIHQYFVTPDEAGGARSYYLSKVMAEQGHDVVVMTSNTRHADWPLVRESMIGNVKVVYVRNAYDGRMNKFARILSYGKFVVFSTWLSLRQKNIDMVFASSTPLTIGIPALAMHYIKKRPFVLELRDIWPDVPYELGFIRGWFFYRSMKRFEGWLYRKAAKIITISDGMREVIDSKYLDKTRTYPFGSNLELFQTTKKASWKTDNDIAAPTLYVFTGAVGIANDVFYLVEAARIVEEQRRLDIHIAIVGDGSARDQIRSLITEYRLSNLSMHDPVPIEQLDNVYAAADAGVILFGTKSPTYRRTASPNKLFDYIAAGLPVLFNFSGPLQRTLIDQGAGVYTDYQDPRALALAMMRLADHPDELRAMGVAARRLAEERYDRNKILTDLSHEIAGTPRVREHAR